MRESAALVTTTSFRTSPDASRLPARAARPRAACGAPRSGRSPSSTPSSVGYSSGSVISVRKPRLPKLTPRTGTGFSSRWLAASSVPSPPSTTSASAARGHLARRGATVQAGGQRAVDERGRALLEADARRRARCSQAHELAQRGAGLAEVGPREDADRAHARTAALQHRVERASRHQRRPPGAQVQEELAVALGAGDGRGGRRRARRSPAACAARRDVARAPAGAAPGSLHDAAAAHLAAARPRTAASPARPRPLRRPARRAARAGSCSTEMNDTSMVASAHGSGTSPRGERARVRRARARPRAGRARSLSWSWPRPTSTA